MQNRSRRILNHVILFLRLCWSVPKIMFRGFAPGRLVLMGPPPNFRWEDPMIPFPDPFQYPLSLFTTTFNAEVI
jgi:hypothetical protein